MNIGRCTRTTAGSHLRKIAMRTAVAGVGVRGEDCRRRCRDRRRGWRQHAADGIDAACCPALLFAHASRSIAIAQTYLAHVCHRWSLLCGNRLTFTIHYGLLISSKVRSITDITRSGQVIVQRGHFFVICCDKARGCGNVAILDLTGIAFMVVRGQCATRG